MFAVSKHYHHHLPHEERVWLCHPTLPSKLSCALCTKMREGCHVSVSVARQPNAACASSNECTGGKGKTAVAIAEQPIAAHASSTE